MKFDDLLKFCVKQGASDIHLHGGMPPHVRLNGGLKSIGSTVLTPAMTDALVGQMCNADQLRRFEEKNQVDLAYTTPDGVRFRVNLFRQRGAVSAVLRVIRGDRESLSRVKLPEQIMDYIVGLKRGIVLVTGPTGSGKSTTLAAILDKINCTRDDMIVTIEDPIEMLHQNQKSVVVQREVGNDTTSFADALVAAMRQDPDVIMIGEIRDYATATAAISAAQTGHLVFSTLHTMDTVRTVNRILELFPPHERDIARSLFADSIAAIISQRLLPTIDGTGRVAGLEILKGTLRVKDMVKDEARTNSLKEAIRDGKLEGMLGFDDHLAQLTNEGLISFETGYSAATSPHEYKLLVQQGEHAAVTAAREQEDADEGDDPFIALQTQFDATT